jgi:mitochondrial fission protein ELM1
LIWALIGSKAGDNAQILRLADALDIPYETRRLEVEAAFETRKPRVTASLHHLDLERSDRLSPPWPDLVITTGRRLSMAALWIKKQSGGTSKLALIGCPKAEISAFDLIVAPLHYRLPPAANILRIGLPLTAIDRAKLAAAAREWAPRFADLPRPLTVLLVGGTTGRRRFTPQMAREILSRIPGDRGTLYIATSRRTPAAAIEAIEEAMPAGAVLYRWRAEDRDNPYLGLLALGDRFIVTGDSISMLVEVARLGRPLAIASLGGQGLLEKLFPANRIRDIAALHEYLYEGGWAVPLGKPFSAPRSPPPDDTPIAAARLQVLLSLKTSAAPSSTS